MVRNALAAVLSWVSSLSTRGTCADSCFPHRGMTLCSALGERFPRESGVFIILRGQRETLIRLICERVLHKTKISANVMATRVKRI